MRKLARLILLLSLCFEASFVAAQLVPSEVESVQFLSTFGSQADTKWGDDDFSQVFFFVVPSARKDPFYIRVFDPDCGGKIDEAKGTFNTKTRFAVYGGKGAFSHPDSKKVDPERNYKAGTMLASKVFGVNASTDNKWYSFGPFNASEGEVLPGTNSMVFKLITDGVTGDDGNLYKYFLSSSELSNNPVVGGNAFTYEYSMRLTSEKGSVTHIYPFIDNSVVSIIQNNFDADDDLQILLYSVVKNRHPGKVSGENNWAKSTHRVMRSERNTSIDLQLIKKSSFDNDVVLYITNQYNEPIPFYSVPIGGPPKLKYNVKVDVD